MLFHCSQLQSYSLFNVSLKSCLLHRTNIQNGNKQRLVLFIYPNREWSKIIFYDHHFKERNKINLIFHEFKFVKFGVLIQLFFTYWNIIWRKSEYILCHQVNYVKVSYCAKRINTFNFHPVLSASFWPWYP